MNALEELNQYINEDSVTGQLARELREIMADYQSGGLTAKDKDDLIKEIIDIRAANDLAGDEENYKLIYAIGMGLLSVV